VGKLYKEWGYKKNLNCESRKKIKKEPEKR